MNTTRRKVLSLLLVLMLALVSVIAVGCKWNDDDPTGKTEWPEAGVYYFDSGIDEYTLTLNVGDTFALIVKGESNSGTYTLAEDGKIFLDFYADEKESASANLENDVITLTYEGATMRFLKKVNYTFKFETNGGNSMEDLTVVNGKTVSKPADPTRSGFVFVGWYADSEFKTPYAFGAQPVLADTTVYARWSEASADGAEYTVNFDLNYPDAEALEATKTFGGKLFELPAPERAGYAFQGWWISMEQDGSKLSYRYTDGMVLNANTTLYALWQSTDTGSALQAPVVNVAGSTVSWNSVSGARSYNVKILTSDDVLVLDENVGATTINVPFADYEAGEYKIVVTAYANSGDENNSEAVRFYTNKALDKVSSFDVVGSYLVFNTVENAEKYLITVSCGNPDHNHTNFDNGNSRTFNFANCVMTSEGIKFTVTAVAEGYASSVSKEFVYKRVLNAVDGLAYDDAAQLVTWNPVDDAAYYMVSVTCGNADHNHEFVNVGLNTSVSLKECDAVTGGIVVKVYPVTNGYASPEASQIACEKAALATPSGLLINGTLISWNANENAEKFEVKIGANVYETATNSFDISALLNGVEGYEYEISVRAIGEGSSLWSDVLTAKYFELADELVYANSTLTWTPVIGADRYEIQVNNGNIVVVDNGAYSGEITLNKAGVNVVKVRFVDGSHVSEWVQTEVLAYAVTLDTLGGSNLGVVYKAIGDKMNLPAPTKTGYGFVEWYNVPGGPESNGKAYTDANFAENGAIVLYAYYTPNKITVDYNYGLGGSADKENDQVEYERDYQLVVPTPDSVTAAFGGWFSAPYGTGVQYTDAKGNSLAPWTSLEGTELYAFWADPTLKFTLTKVNNRDAYMVSAGERIALVDEITIPATYMGLPVAMVAGNAFKDCSNLKVINLPSTIEQISYVDPFVGCTGLEAINVYDVEGTTTVRYWSEDGVLFYNGATGNAPASIALMPVAKTGTYRIPDGISEINGEAFANSAISKVVVPASVTKIAKEAFLNCANLTSVVFEVAPAGQAEQALTIGARAFANCTKLERVILPARLTEINLTKYTVSGTEVSVDGTDNAFDGCTALNGLTVASASATYKSVDGVLYSADGKTLLYCPATKEGKFTVPTGVQTIAPGAFVGCDEITEVEIPNTIIYVGECAFYGLDYNLTKVTFRGNNLNTGVTVGKYAFRDCKYLSELVLEPACQLAVLGEGAFYGCWSIESFTIPSSMTKIEAEAFRDCAYLGSVTFADSTKTLEFGENVFYDCTELQTIHLPANVSKVPGIFSGCTSLESVTVADDSQYFTSEEGVLFNKDKTEIIFFPQGKTGEYTLPATVKVINDGVFSNVKGLTTLTLPNTLEVIGDEAFKSFKGELVFTGDTYAAALTIGNSAFKSAQIPSLTLPAHTKTVGDNVFESAYMQSITLNEGLQNLGKEAFYNASGFSELSIPGSVKVIGERCFYYNTSISSLTLNEGLEVIGKDAFRNTYYITALEIPSTVLTIDDRAFQDSYLNTITFAPNSQLRTIGGYAFDSTRIVTITIPKTVTSVGAYAFYYCSKLEEVIFEEGGTEPLVVGSPYVVMETNWATGNLERNVKVGHVFEYTYYLESVAFPARLTELKEYSFYNAAYYSELSVDFGENSQLKTIGAYCFYYSNLVEITIPKSVCNLDPVVDDEFGLTYDRMGIGDYAFGGLYDTLTSVTFEKGGTAPLTIGKNAFDSARMLEALELPARLAPYTSHTGDVLDGLANGAGVFNETFDSWYGTGLSSVTVEDGSEYYASVEGVLFSKDMTELIFCPALKEGKVTVPATVTKIGDRAFYSCTNLTELEFVGGTEDMVIGNEAFYDCVALTSIALPANVVSLGASAFKGCEDLETLSLPKKLANFDAGMIEGCDMLKSIAVEAGNAVVYSDAGVLYSADKTTLICYPAYREGTTYTVLPETKIIAESAFEGNVNLEVVVLPDGLVEINNYAFSQARALTTVEIPKTVELLGENAFGNCTQLENLTFAKGNDTKLIVLKYAFQNCAFTSLELPARTVSLGNYVFYYSKLAEITFEDGSELTTMGDQVFQSTKLVNVVFPEGLVSVGESTFYGCSSLESVVFGEGLVSIGASTFERTSVKHVYFPASLKTMGIKTFNQCSSLETVEFAPNAQLEKIPNSTFYMSGLKEFVVPAGVKEIEEKDSSVYSTYGAFEACTRLTSVTFENGSACAKIGNKAFYGCTALEEMEIPSSVMTLGNEVFYNCSSLESVTVPVTATQLGQSLFYGCRALSDVTLETRVTELPGYMFYNCSALTTIKIPASVSSFGTNCFAGAGITAFDVEEGSTAFAVADGVLYSADMKTIVLYPAGKTDTIFTVPKEVTFIGEGVISRTEYITTVLFEDGGTEPLVIGESAFSEMSALSKVVLPERLESIGDYAFEDCAFLLSINVPAAMEESDFGTNAFDGCIRLVEVLNESEIELTAGDTVCGGLVLNAIRIYTEGESTANLDENGYITIAEGGEVYLVGYTGTATELTIPTGVTVINPYTFRDMEITEVVLPEGLKVIGEGAFYDCADLESVQMPNTVTTIGDGAFYYCSYLENINIPTGLKTIGDLAFYSCRSLGDIVLPEGLESIGDSAFDSCYGITSINLPSTLKNISEGAFGYCDGLDGSVFVLGEGLETIGAEAFYGCGELMFLVSVTEKPEGWDDDWAAKNWNGDPYAVLWGYTGEDVTYTFNSNGGSAVDSITSADAITLPEGPTLDGHVFMGWYDNEELEGEAITAKYYSTVKTTLYAKFMTEAEYAELFRGTTMDLPFELVEGVTYDCEIAVGGGQTYFVITVEAGETWNITTGGSGDHKLFFYNADQSQKGSYDSGYAENYDYTFSEAGTYYIGIGYYSSYSTGTITVIFTKK